MPEEPKRPLKVFLCHAHPDAEKVRALYARLKADGVDAWLDKENIIPGQDWEFEIRKAVRESDIVVVCLSKQFSQKGYRQNEVRIALEEASLQPEGEIFIIPARLEECNYLEILKRFHGVDLFEERGYEYLMRALRLRADKIGAVLQSKKGWLGGLTSPIKKPDTQKPKPVVKPKPDHNAAEKAQLEAEELARQKATEEKARREAAERADRENARQQAAKNRRDLIRKTILDFSLNLKSTIHKMSPLTWTFALLLIVGAIWTLWISSNATPLPFSGSEEGGVDIYVHYGEKIDRATSPSQNVKNWSPILGMDNNIYFSSDRDGKFEIYRLVDGKVRRVTTTPEKYESWSPAFSLNNDLYFTSNRDGKAEIYRLMDGHTERVTTTPGEYESWSPAFSLNNDLYFTSNRDGKAEIYRLKNGSTERVTNTSGTFESWSPAFSLNNDLYFTSNRDGKTEIYRLKDGNTERVTNTPGQCESWGAVAKGQDIYFTSCENWGQYRVYVLNAEPTAVSDILSWTKKRWDKFP